MNRMETGAIIPVSMLRSHQAFRLAIEQSSKGKIRNYLRWLDLMNGEVTVQWEDSFGSYKREALSAYSTDVNVMRFTAWNGASVNAEVEIQLPTENKFEGEDFAIRESVGRSWKMKMGSYVTNWRMIRNMVKKATAVLFVLFLKADRWREQGEKSAFEMQRVCW